MAKKFILLAGLILFISACVITSPAEMFQTTPTICVECVQATICAENQTDDACPGAANQLLTKPTSTESGLTATPAVTSTETLTPTLSGTATPTKRPTITEIPTATEPPTPTEEILPTEEVAPESQATSAAEAAQPVAATALSQEGSASEVGTPVPALPTPTAYEAQPGDWLYKSQPGSPKYIKNFTHPKLNCSWSGIAGQVFGPEGVPQTDIVVVISGEANGTPIDEVGFTGSAPAYGENAYEIELPTGPVNSKDTMMIQLLDLQGKELSMRYFFDTYIDCKKGLVIFNFVQAK